MSDEMAVSDNPSGEESGVNGAEALAASAEDAAPEASEAPSAPTDPEPEEIKPIKTEPEEKECNSEEGPESSEDIDDKRGVKRRASAAFTNATDEDFKGFAKMELDDSIVEYKKVLDNLEAEVALASKTVVPLRTVMGTPTAPARASKRARQDTDGSRPSSALSSRSEDGVSSTEVSSPAVRGRRATTEMSSPLLRVPLEKGWKRELVYRAALDQHSRRNADIYYYTPQGKKLRSTREVGEHLSGTGLTLDNFSFFKEPLGVDDPDKEIIRDAKLMRKVESPVAQTAPPAEGKRTPKPKPPKGASPEPVTPKSPPAKIKVKSMQPRLSRTPAAPPAKKPAATPAADNNNTQAGKKNSDTKPVRGRLANGAAPPPAADSPRRRGRPRQDDVDHFTTFHQRAKEHNYNVAVQIFQYLGMRDLAHCARVCRLWRELAATPQLWRHVRMKNSHVSDWGGLFAALRRHGTKRLDLRKMLLPQNDAVFWEQFGENVKQLDQLERIEMCRCPASAVEAVCRGVSNLRSLSAIAIRSALLDPAPLGALPHLHELRLKSMAGLSLTRDLQPLAALTRLTHLSLTSIKELGWCACDVVGQLPQLESLELGECSFRAEFALVLGKLSRLKRLRLERGTAQCAAPALLRALALLPNLTSLELVNFDVKVGFDDALAECKNIQRLLIIPTYVSQSATTNKQVLSGVLRLKDTLTHLMWGVTIELLRVTELFIDQCEQGAERRRDVGECIPVLKPVPGCRLPPDNTKQEARTPPQVHTHTHTHTHQCEQGAAATWESASRCSSLCPAAGCRRITPSRRRAHRRRYTHTHTHTHTSASRAPPRRGRVHPGAQACARLQAAAG
ncbi:uncharacterized protein LOC125237657 isoform X2 [Leguminivora glycinivorella]|uniref:uncharacterized protein LOC125237657 isoform X2 n=1 Tax=Leguminivora glycinivorella TaxID=1035111 RepID=UPI00200EC927|nr:uncharacterized protein LOC125237657 isoform X2 [Leguminivora glycinivorella]